MSKKIKIFRLPNAKKWLTESLYQSLSRLMEMSSGPCWRMKLVLKQFFLRVKISCCQPEKKHMAAFCVNIIFITDNLNAYLRRALIDKMREWDNVYAVSLPLF